MSSHIQCFGSRDGGFIYSVLRQSGEATGDVVLSFLSCGEDRFSVPLRTIIVPIPELEGLGGREAEITVASSQSPSLNLVLMKGFRPAIDPTGG